MKVGGQFLDGVTNVYVSGADAHAAVIEYRKPLTPQQFNSLREKAKELQDKRQASFRARRQRTSNSKSPAWTAADEKALAEIRAKLASFQRRPASPAIAETATLQVTAGGEAAPGHREIRLGTPQGLSNPLTFCIGQLPEIRKPEAQAQNGPPGRRPLRTNEPRAAAPVEMNITLPAIVNGQILPGGIDRYRFPARQGQKLVMSVSARDLIPYIPDAVPGWFQATLTLYDGKGKELAYSDDYRFHPDPVLYFEVPRQGDYVVEVRDSVYRGREDFVYRISISESPFITSMFPLGGPAGAETKVALSGWNLPATNLSFAATDQPGVSAVSVSKGKLLSNHVPLARDTLPDCNEREPNDSATNAQTVTLPIIVNGRVEGPGDWDVFSFRGQAGQEIVAEVYARRLNSPLDSELRLTDAAGRQLAFNDDHEDKGSGLNTHHADSYLRAVLPAAGLYFVHLGDAQHQGGPDYAYRLRISPPEPDFELRVTPSSINVRAGFSFPLTVYALRKDGFTNEITLALDDAPAGFSLSGERIPAGQDQVRLTVSAQAAGRKEPINISLQGRAKIGGRFVTRKAVPAEDMMQAFAYRHLVPAQELKVAVTGRGFGRAGLQLASALPVKIPVGGAARLRLGGLGASYLDRFDLELSDPPPGVSLGKAATTERGAEIVFESDAKTSKAGLKGNLIVGLVPARNPAATQKAKKQANPRRVPLGTLPAIPFEIVPGN